MLIGQVPHSTQLDYELHPGRKAWVHVIRGAASVNGRSLSTGDAAALTGEKAVAIQGDEANTEVLVFDLA